MYRILVVDDEKPIRRILCRILGEKEFECVEAANVQEAREQLDKGSFDLVLSDVNMPGESGVDLVRYIKENHPAVPVIMATVLNDPLIAREIINLGVYGYVTKPFDPNQVKIQVFNALKRKQLEKENESYRESLEKQIEERTAELRAAVAELEHAQQQLRESEERFRNISTHAKDGIVMIDGHGKITFWNTAAEQIFGYGSEEMIGRPLHDVLAPRKYNQLAREALALFRETGKGNGLGKTLELEALHKSGGVVPVELSVSAVQMRGEWHAIGIIRDISLRKEAEEKLKKVNAEMSQIFRSMTSILIGVDEHGTILQWNPRAEEFFGLAADEITGASFFQLPLPFDKDLLANAVHQCRTGGAPVALEEVPYRLASGKEGFLKVTVSPIQSEQLQFSGFILLAEDITNRRIMEMQLAQAQKLESIGQLAAGIAHEINTPIQYVGDNTRFLKDAFADFMELIRKYQQLKPHSNGNGAAGLTAEIERLEQEIDLDYLAEEVPRSIEEALEGVERVAKIVSAMKEFSHPGMEEKTPIDLNRALESTITVSRNEWKYVAEVETDFDPSLPLVACLPGDVNQVFLNIIVNAAHAIHDVVGDSGEKGKITIATRHVDGFAEVRISDTGTGIPEGIRSRIFDPFFTTKEVGKGTGQGLAISHNIIVQKHGGTITCESEVGKGTTFIIRLPLDMNEEEKEATLEESLDLL